MKHRNSNMHAFANAETRCSMKLFLVQEDAGMQSSSTVCAAARPWSMTECSK
jgi:hypothetical protein